MKASHLVLSIALLAAACGGGGGGGGSSTPTGPSAPSGPSQTTIVVSNQGVNPNQVRIEIGSSVTFVNQASANKEMNSDPHPTHELCPPFQSIGMMTPGQSKTATFTVRGTCTFHEHGAPDDSRFRGTILVGVNEPGPAPDYRTAPGSPQ